MAAKSRAFKTTWFAKHAKKARISDEMLCVAFREVLAGQCDDLGGGVFKKRLSNNEYRSIIVSKSRGFWIFEFLFAKKNRANIDAKELAAFKKLAGAYDGLTNTTIGASQKRRSTGDLQ
jgi:hypothetical protein